MHQNAQMMHMSSGGSGSGDDSKKKSESQRWLVSSSSSFYFFRLLYSIYTFNFDSVNFNSTCTRSPKPWQRFKEKVIDKQTDYLKILLEKTLRIFVKLSRFIYTRPVCIRSDCVG
jgi:hypothetical protein